MGEERRRQRGIFGKKKKKVLLQRCCFSCVVLLFFLSFFFFFCVQGGRYFSPRSRSKVSIHHIQCHGRAIEAGETLLGVGFCGPLYLLIFQTFKKFLVLFFALPLLSSPSLLLPPSLLSFALAHSLSPSFYLFLLGPVCAGSQHPAVCPGCRIFLRHRFLHPRHVRCSLW